MPDRRDFAPEPHRIVAFVVSLVELGAGPLEAKLKVRKQSGQFAQAAHRRASIDSETRSDGCGKHF
jgi:hypothetical protein